MNEKQKALRDTINNVITSTSLDGREVVDANEYRTVTRHAMALLADEPEKSLRDYALVELADLVHDMAKEQGWWDAPRKWPEISCLIHSEISEAVECYRRGEMALHVVDGKPEGFVVELADVVIRCLDYAAYSGMVAYVSEKSVTDIYNTVVYIPDWKVLDRLHEAHLTVGALTDDLVQLTYDMFALARRLSLDLPAAIEAKIQYNATRPYRHGGKKA